ncbi:hypothetical protein JCM16303_007298 [Sporobolomyces ruberrimus]
MAKPIRSIPEQSRLAEAGLSLSTSLRVRCLPLSLFMTTLFFIAPIPSPMSSKGSLPDLPYSIKTSSTPRSSSSASQNSYKSYSPLLNPSAPPHRRLHLFCTGLVKTVLWSVTLVIIVLVFLSRPHLGFSRSRPPKVARSVHNLTLTEYLNGHFPLDLPRDESPHVWISLADRRFADTGSANLDVFFKQLNSERKAFYGKGGRRVRDSIFVTLCMDEGCADVCEKRDMYCYEGYEKTRPEMVRPASLSGKATAFEQHSTFERPLTVAIVPHSPPTWPKLASMIETLPLRDVFFIDADIGFRQDPFPHLEPLMEVHDVLMQENFAFAHGNSGFMWMKQSTVMAQAWQSVLEMDLIEDSRDQVNLNTVLDTTARRLAEGAEVGDGTPVKDDFIAKNGLSVHILDQRLFRITHIMEQVPWFERHDSLLHHATCADETVTKLFVAKAEGYWSDVDQYYTKPPSLISIESVSATDAEATQLFKLLLALGHYTGRAVLPPLFVTVTDNAEVTSKAVHGPSAFPTAHLSTAFNVTVVEPRYIRHAQAHLLGQSTLDPKRGREDPGWTKLSRKEKKAREDLALALTKTSEIDLRRYITFADLVARLLLPDIAFSRHVELVHYDQSPFWPWWQLDTLPVRHLRPCENTTLPWECGELCRGAEELKQGTIQEDWLPVGDIKW